MPLIEGIGDEVTALVGCLVILVIIVISWMSTHVNSTVHTSVVIIDRERFAELLYRVRGIAVRSSAIVRQTLGNTTGTTAVPAASTEPEAGLSRDSVVASGQPTASNSELMEHDIRLSSDVRVSSDTSCQTPDRDNVNTGITSFRSSPPTNAVEITDTRPPQTGNTTASANPIPSLSSTDTVSSEEGSSGSSGHLNDNLPPGCVEIRLQFVDGHQRTVFANPDETIGDFKRCHFASELANNSVVRFVAGGQELRDESSTLRSHRLASSGAVLHCLVTPPRASSTPAGSRTTPRQFDIGMLMFPLFGSMLAALWYARIVYRGYFNGTSTFSLLAISFLYVVAVLASLRGGEPGQQQYHAHAD
jgi:hypothetical protein